MNLGALEPVLISYNYFYILSQKHRAGEWLHFMLPFLKEYALTNNLQNMIK